ncbi:c-type cytochrome [Polyangium aurulentum]|uniref:c-type cytochrome n=1 Tax=Polyangium aurulentum TaxID=2567896 RepID=UPI0010AE9DDA|nr:c-type cytochrome [Polyangium aurulentum]UQA63089.1 c-type cytochrome [Polyangium aurulentum]
MVRRRWLGLSVILAASACGGGGAGIASSTHPPSQRSPALAPPAPAEARASASHAPRSRDEPSACAPAYRGAIAPLRDARQSSSIALARAKDRVLAYVADEDDDALHTVDLDSRKELAVTPLPGSPSQVLVLPDGRLVVALRDRNELLALEAPQAPEEPLALRCRVPIAAEPIALATTPDGGRLLVTSGRGKRLTILGTGGLEAWESVELARDPRGVLVSRDGRKAFVTHMVGSRVSVVSLDGAIASAREVDVRVDKREGSQEPRVSNQGFALAAAVLDERAGAERIFAPLASVDPGKSQANVFPGGYGGVTGPRIVSPFVAVVDPAAERMLNPYLAAKRSSHGEECVLPRAAAAYGARLLVACAGIDAVVELDARAMDPIAAQRRRFDVPSGPTGIAIDEDGRRAVAWSQFAREISFLDLREPGGRTLALPLARRQDSRITPVLARGREIFHETDDFRISVDGRACASCHPDGRDDGLTWATPDGPRQTIMLAGRIEGSGPYGWFGVHPTLGDHVAHTFGRLGGHGLDEPADEGDLRALLAYLVAMRPPPPVEAKDPALVARGRDLFLDAEHGCVSCHMDGGTDRARHDVGSGRFIEQKLTFDTPSLRYVGVTAPYFHDGRYATLLDLLRASDAKMGHTGGLGDDDLRALAAYMETL